MHSHTHTCTHAQHYTVSNWHVYGSIRVWTVAKSLVNLPAGSISGRTWYGSCRTFSPSVVGLWGGFVYEIIKKSFHPPLVPANLLQPSPLLVAWSLLSVVFLSAGTRSLASPQHIFFCCFQQVWYIPTSPVCAQGMFLPPARDPCVVFAL